MAKPQGADNEPTPDFVLAWNIFHNHTIVAENPDDERNLLLPLTGQGWKKRLHPKLSSIADMMARLGDQVQPEYALLDTPPEQDHLHEAFRRILLEQILSMEDDEIPLTPNISRKPPIEKRAGQERGARMEASAIPGSSKATNQSKKRKATDEGDTERYHKSVRSSGGGVFSPDLHEDRYLND